MPRRGNNSDERLIALFLDMLAAERGAGKNTLAAYAHDLGDLSAHLATNGSTIANATTDELRGYLGALAKRGRDPPGHRKTGESQRRKGRAREEGALRPDALPQ